MKPALKAVISVALIAFVLIAAVLSVSLGARHIHAASLLSVLGFGSGDPYEVAIIAARIPRTVFGLLAGAALAVSGALMQSITRNPIADPSILGVNTGAALAVVSGMSFFHITTNAEYILFAFTGAMVTAIAVYGLASLGYEKATPLKLALAGAAASTALQSLVNAIMLPDGQLMDRFRFWQTGSIGGATWNDIHSMAPILGFGLILAICLSKPMNAMALGDEMATSLGVNVQVTRLLVAFAGVILCASVTAMAGPIGFVGLMIPHFIRTIVGPDMRWVTPLSALAGGALLVISDVIGRLVGNPGELEVGIVTALLGAPVFIFIVRKVKVRKIS